MSKQYKAVLERGDSGPGVQVIQYYLRFIGTFNDFIPTVEPDEVFGAATENAVRAFQRAYGLPETGVVDEETWNKMYSTYLSILNGLPEDYVGVGIVPFPGTNLYRGVSGEAVRDLQTYLAEISNTYSEIPKVTVTGYFGPETEQAVYRLPEYVRVAPERNSGTHNLGQHSKAVYRPCQRQSKE